MRVAAAVRWRSRCGLHMGLLGQSSMHASCTTCRPVATATPHAATPNTAHFAGPRPLINDGLVDGPTTTAAGAGVQQSGDALAATQKGGAVGAAAAAGRSKVRVDFYGESLCPDCQHMVRDVSGGGLVLR